MSGFFSHFVEQYGYAGVALFVTLEGFGIPLPGETAVVTAAALAATGSLSLPGVVIAASIGAVLGGSGGYWIGRIGGRELLVRHGDFFRLTPERLHRTEVYFARHGASTVFFARFVALLRIFGCLFAGVAEMPFVSFSLVNLAGGVLWAATFSALGYLFGRNLPLLDAYIGRFSLLVSLIVVIAIAAYLIRRRRAVPSS